MQSRLRPIGANGEGFAARFLLARRDMGYPAVTQGLEDNPMTVWVSEDEKEAMVTALIDKLGRLPPPRVLVSATSQEDVFKLKMELETLETASRTANASERNAKYMLWATVAAAASAVASFLAVIVPLLIKH